MTEKEGLQAAIDFTKYLLTLSGGAIAFIIQPNFFSSGEPAKLLSLSSLAALVLCVLSGLVVFSAGAVMLARKNYDLEFRHIRWAGLINVFSFALGFVLLAIVVGMRLTAAPPPPSKPATPHASLTSCSRYYFSIDPGALPSLHAETLSQVEPSLLGS
jgi:hypothetical protein